MVGRSLIVSLVLHLTVATSATQGQDLADLLTERAFVPQPTTEKESAPEAERNESLPQAEPVVVATASVVPEACTVDIASYLLDEELPAEEIAPAEPVGGQPLARKDQTTAALTAALFTPVMTLNINPAPPTELVERMNDPQGYFRIQNPAEQRFGDFDNPVFDAAFQPARFAMSGFDWVAPSLYHWPLYFEQPNVERYGHYVALCDGGNLLQSAACAAHFFTVIPVLPYKLGADPCHERQYVLGTYRPGSCNPHRLVRPELSARGLLYQGIFTTGVIFVTP